MNSKSPILLLAALMLLNACAPAPVPTAAPVPTEAPAATAVPAPTDAPPPPDSSPLTAADAGTQAGFHVLEPGYLPEGAVFDRAEFQQTPAPAVTLFFNYYDFGPFFQIVQQPTASALPNPDACGVNGGECETLQAGGTTVRYRLTAPTETVMWEANGFSFQLLRMAGEPERIYKEELLKVVESMK